MRDGRARARLIAGVCAASLLLGATVAAAEPGVPRAARTRRTQPAWLIVAPSRLAGAGLDVSLAPGCAVVLGAGPPPWPAPLAVRTVGEVEIAGTVPAGALGLRVLRAVPLTVRVGSVRLAAGTLVRPTGSAKPDGQLEIETVGPVTARGLVPATALGTGGAPPLLADPDAVTLEETRLLDRPGGVPVARLAAGAEVRVLSRDAKGARVRTLGGVDVEGWLGAQELAKPGPDGEPVPSPRPTHEALVDMPFFAAPWARQPAGVLRGGTLLVVSSDPAGKGAGTYLPVRTRGPVSLRGWVRRVDLRTLELLPR